MELFCSLIKNLRLKIFSNCKFLLSLTFVVLPMYRIAMKKLHLHMCYMVRWIAGERLRYESKFIQ